MKDAATPLSFNACVFDTDRSLWKSSVICHKKSLMNHSLSYMTGRNCQMEKGYTNVKVGTLLHLLLLEKAMS